MKRFLSAMVLAIFILTAPLAASPAFCKSGPAKSTQVSSSVGRTSSGKIKRSSSAKREFMKQSGHPHGWRGHQVHHKRPLYKGGSDTPRNMQWVTDRQHKQIHSER